uniref:NADH-ubiquinone oxidoreductase chain 6 n=1 Tax=Coelorinchus kishinouyei TaxID=143328 RepID=Q94T09_9TELE|nr:NADH dehydrogenase subunit 6 [Coelorinchus kishinouyei]BAB70168.1 NADH dehydrogenase subunit 6 [Coelorinchus kishinouyei]
MFYMMMMMMVGFVLGAAALASNPSPVYAVLGLVLMAGMACMILINSGGPFLSLLFFLVYLGGMLVVFAHCVALAAERYPKAWGDVIFLGALVGVVVGYSVAVIVGWVNWFGVGSESGYDFDDYSFICPEGEGLGLLYDKGGWLLLFCVIILLVVLVVVLELTRGRSQGALRAI